MVSFVVNGSARTKAQHVPIFKTAIDPVHVGVTVTDRKGNLVADLTADNFEIWEDGKKQAIRHFAPGGPGEPGPAMHFGVLLDVSESMGDDLSFTKKAAIRFLNTLSGASDITVVDFDTEVRVARYEQPDFARLVERIRQKNAVGSTAL